MQVHSYLTPKCEARRSGDKKHGVFAISEVVKEELIAVWGGKIYYVPELKKSNDETENIFDLSVPVFENFILGPTDINNLDDVEFMNHSCDPNAGIKGQIVLVARREIQPGEEVCFDYETAELGSLAPFQCQCDATNCRGWIDGTAWKDPEFQQRNIGYFSRYLHEHIAKYRQAKQTN